MKCLITGINGFLAKYISQEYLSRGWQVYGIYHSSPVYHIDKKRQYNLHLPDKGIYEILESIKPNLIIHTAGTASVGASVEAPYLDFRLSVPATAIILDAIREKSPDTGFIFLSSAAVYGNPQYLPVPESADIQPISPYGYHKHMGEQLCDEFSNIYGLRTSVARIFSAYGPGLQKQVVYDLVRKSINALHKNEPLEVIGTGDESRDFVHARDVARAVIAISQFNTEDSHADIFNVASGSEVKIKHLVESINQVIGNSPEINYSMKTRKGDPLRWEADISKLKLLDFEPLYALSDGLKTVIDEIVK